MNVFTTETELPQVHPAFKDLQSVLASAHLPQKHPWGSWGQEPLSENEAIQKKTHSEVLSIVLVKAVVKDEVFLQAPPCSFSSPMSTFASCC